MMVIKHDFRLPKTEILKRSADIKAVMDRGKRWEGQIIKCYYYKADQRKIGFIVPKRLGKAVFRNRIKRLMREVYRHHRHAVGNFWILLITKKTERSPHLREIETEFCQFTLQCGIEFSQ